MVIRPLAPLATERKPDAVGVLPPSVFAFRCGGEGAVSCTGSQDHEVINQNENKLFIIHHL